MSQNQRNQLQITNAENIALFSLLHDVPVQPSTNKATAQQTKCANYNLSFETERRLADTLAFLASIEDDSRHIPAICVGEDPEKNCFNVYIAVNKRHWDDGNDLLRDTKQKFDHMFQLLEKNSFKYRDNAEENGGNRRIFKKQVFSAVVSMCSSRILARLCLNGKKDFKETILRVVDSINQNNSSPSAKNKNSLSLFVTKARALVKLVDLWAKYQIPSRLEDLVEGAYQLQKTEMVQVALNGIPNRDLDPSRRDSLLNIIQKVARYRQAARFLYRLIVKERRVSQLKAIAVSPPKEYFERTVPSAEYHPQLSSILSRIHPQYAKERNMSQIRRLLSRKGESIDEEFSARIRRILSRAKVHAEVQLIAHCELHLPGSGLPSRVICSSKDACYLCNLTISMFQGKPYTPRSHGRLYSGWRLPLQQQQLAIKFNQTLETKIKENLTILLQKQERRSYPFPLESTLATFSPSITTLCDSSINNGSVASWISRKHKVPARALQSVETPKTTYRRPLEFNSVGSPDQESRTDGFVSDNLSQNLHLCNEDDLNPRIIPLKETTKSQNELLFFSNEILEVQIELEPPEPDKFAINQKKIAYSIEWLDETAEKREKCHTKCVIDAGSFRGEILHELCDQNSLYITLESSMLRFKVH